MRCTTEFERPLRRLPGLLLGLLPLGILPAQPVSILAEVESSKPLPWPGLEGFIQRQVKPESNQASLRRS